jgi:carboxypeptidase family protein
MSAGTPASDPSAAPAAADPRPGPLLRVRGHLSLPRVQAVFGLIAALLSIGGALYGYLRPGRTPHTGDVVAIVQEARSGKLVSDTTVEILTPRDALVTTLSARGGEAHSPMREGSYRLRVTHPRFAPEVRQIQVIAGQTTQVQFRLAPRSGSALSTLNEGLDSLRKKVFRSVRTR